MVNPTSAAAAEPRSFATGALAASLVALVAAHVLFVRTPEPALARETTIGRDYALVTSPIQRGGDGVYVIDNRLGMVMLLTWDSGARTLVPKDVRRITDVGPAR